VTSSVAIVLGTYNRLDYLKRAVASIEQAVTKYPYSIVIVDGGSTDGTQEWIKLNGEACHLIHIQQELPLKGAVNAFNRGFEWACGRGYDFVMHMNDDAEIVTPKAIDRAIDQMLHNPMIGEVAFAFDLWSPGTFHFDFINGAPYANYGVVRTTAGKLVAQAQGDKSGTQWWNQIYHTYAADTEFGVWLWKLGWVVHCDSELHVHDLRADDALRAANSGDKRERDSELFWSRWRDEPLEQRMKEVLGQ
jgi:glycosyltransferase involved in cell wall biosynthesis